MRPIHALPRVPAPIVSCPRRRAFTLIETTVVLVVAGILLAVAAPRFARFRDASGVRGAMTDLGAAFALARQTAMARRAHASVVLDTAGGVVEVHSGMVTLARHSLRISYGVIVGADRDSAVYDARGLGYGLSDLSVTVRRGSFVDTLTMSKLGRTRW